MKFSSATNITETVTNMVQISTQARAGATELGGGQKIDQAVVRAEDLLDSVFGDRVTEDERRAFVSLCVIESAFSWVKGYKTGCRGGSEEDLKRAFDVMEEIDKYYKRRDDRRQAEISEDLTETDRPAIIGASRLISPLRRFVLRIRAHLSGESHKV
ncbi:MAG: hypothetical protein OXE84_06150 [Rhodobacteraceae bacterium]|nr:hypothetical protein [Paracoccaceae bacterium]MCY4196887.1 hypothetical protein [Paracoccaceae bacterium]